MELALAALVLALVVNECIHNAFEIWGARQKVHWLSKRMDSQPHGDWPLNINTAFKAYALHASMLIVFTSAAYVLLRLLDPSMRFLLQASVFLLLFSYILTTIKVHAFHEEIGRLIRRYKRAKS